MSGSVRREWPTCNSSPSHQRLQQEAGWEASRAAGRGHKTTRRCSGAGVCGLCPSAGGSHQPCLAYPAPAVCGGQGPERATAFGQGIPEAYQALWPPRVQRPELCPPCSVMVLLWPSPVSLGPVATWVRSPATTETPGYRPLDPRSGEGPSLPPNTPYTHHYHHGWLHPASGPQPAVPSELPYKPGNAYAVLCPASPFAPVLSVPRMRAWQPPCSQVWVPQQL